MWVRLLTPIWVEFCLRVCRESIRGRGRRRGSSPGVDLSVRRCSAAARVEECRRNHLSYVFMTSLPARQLHHLVAPPRASNHIRPPPLKIASPSPLAGLHPARPGAGLGGPFRWSNGLRPGFVICWSVCGGTLDHKLDQKLVPKP